MSLIILVVLNFRFNANDEIKCCAKESSTDVNPILYRAITTIKFTLNGLQRFPKNRFWWVIVTTLYRLIPKITVTKNCPTIGEHASVRFLA